MKKILLCLLILLISNLFLGAQTTYSSTFSDGTQKEVTFEYDDPNQISRLRIGLGFFGMDVPKEPAITFVLHPEYRLNERLLLEGIFRFPYGRSSDSNVPDGQSNSDRFKTYSNLRIIGHYDLINRIKKKEKRVAIDWGYNGTLSTVYVIEIPRNFLQSVSFDFGIHRNTVSSNLPIGLKDQTNMSRDFGYHLTSHRSVSVQTGFSHYKAESYKMITNGVGRSYFRMRRVYANIIYAFVNKGDYYQGDTKIKDESILDLPEKKSLGWVLGYAKHLGIRNSGLSAWFGIEIGGLPFMAREGYKNNIQLATPSSIFSMHFGLAYGKRPRK